jgi:hypothetical protein
MRSSRKRDEAAWLEGSRAWRFISDAVVDAPPSRDGGFLPPIPRPSKGVPSPRSLPRRADRPLPSPRATFAAASGHEPRPQAFAWPTHAPSDFSRPHVNSSAATAARDTQQEAFDDAVQAVLGQVRLAPGEAFVDDAFDTMVTLAQLHRSLHPLADAELDFDRPLGVAGDSTTGDATRTALATERPVGFLPRPPATSEQSRLQFLRARQEEAERRFGLIM